MAKKCHIDESLLVDYLDDSLSETARTDLEHHLNQCDTCRNKVAAQQQWFGLMQHSGLDQDRLPADDAQTLARLQQRLKTEMDREHLREQKRHTSWKRPVFWLQTAGLAAAVLVIAFTLPLLLNLWQDARSDQESMLAGQMSGQTSPATTAGIKAVDSQDYRTADAASIWSIYKGSLADIDAMNCFYLTDDSTSTESSIGTLTRETTASDRGGETQPIMPSAEVTAENFFLASNHQLNQAGRVLLDVLEEASRLRVMTHATDPNQGVILAGFDADAAEAQADRLRETFKTCQTPLKIEIIKSEDLLLRLEKLEPGLHDRAFCEMPAAELTWILILIGA